MAAAGACAPESSARAVVDGARRALGAPPVGAAFQVRADATVQGPSGTFRTTIHSASDGRVRMRQDASGFDAGVGRSGGWRLSPDSGRVEPLGDGLAFVRGHELHMLALAPHTRLERPRRLGDTRVGGRAVMSVAWSLPTGDSLVIHYASADTVPVGARMLWTDPPVDVTWNDWSADDAARLFRRATFRQGSEEFRYTYDAVSVGVIQDSAYEPPAPRSRGSRRP